MISIIIPAHNEEKRIGATLEEYGRYFSEKKKKERLEWEIIVVINNTQDKTPEIVKKYSKKHKEIRAIEFVEGGKGFAIIEGFKEALKNKKADLIGFVDADMSTSPEAFYDLIVNIKEYDGIIASRYIRGAIVSPKQSIQRILASRVFNFIIRVLFLIPYRDTQLGAKIFKREAVDKILNQLSITQWAFDVNLLYELRKAGYRIKEHPSSWKDTENSTLNLKKASLQMFLAVIRLRLANSPLARIAKPFKPIVKIVWKIVK